MSISPKQFFKDKPNLPKWLTSHKLFKDIETIHKVFPGIGLSNINEDFILNNDDVILDAGKKLIDALNERFIKRKTALIKFREKQPKIGNKRQQSLTDLLSILEALSSQAVIQDRLLTRSNTGKLTINLPSDILLQEKPVFKKGEGLFKVYGKINKLLIENKFKPLKEPETLAAFKIFSSANIPTKKSFRVVFSATGSDGLWDIATMSMRGISSCQSWQGDYRNCLVGSILDPFVGIIYLASNEETDYGSKMTRRCIVRFTVNAETRVPVIVIDRMYPSEDESVINAFIQFIQQKTKNKYSVIYVDGDIDDDEKIKDLYMPLTELRTKIGNLDLNKIDNEDMDSSEKIEIAREAQYGGTASYQDTFIPSKMSVSKDKHAILFEKNAIKKIAKFQSGFKKAFKKSVDEIDLDTLPSSIRAAVKKLSGGTKDIQINPNVIVNHIAHMIANDIINSVNKQDFTNSDTYVRRIYHTYFVRKKEIFETVKTKLTREINGKLKLKNKLKGKQTVEMLNTLSSKIDIQLKEKLKVLVEKRKQNFSGAMPLPG